MKITSGLHDQRGAATLITVMALMMATTSLLLTAVNAQFLNSRIDGNAQGSVRDYLLAEAGLDYAIEYIKADYYRIGWSGSNGNKETTHPVITSQWLSLLDTQSRRVALSLSRSPHHPSFIEVSSQVIDSISNRSRLVISQITRPLGILSPAGEKAPPLVLDGCIVAVTGFPDLYPEIPAGNIPVPAIWSSRQAPCQPHANLDLHQGTVTHQRFRSGELWKFLFSVDRVEYRKLVNDEITQNINTKQRRYWLVSASDLQSKQWTTSLGSSQQPVVLVFPASLGCPAITAGTTIYGIVFYHADCASTNHPIKGNIVGTLAISGSLSIYSEHLDLAHISRASNQQHGLEFPILKIPRLAGTWQDF